MQVHGTGELQAEANRLIASLERREGGATVVTLSGELGAGKTTFAQGIAHSLGVEENVTSPTFVIEKVYVLEGKEFSHLVHIDAYRLKGAHELEILGWKELLAEPGNLIVIEWPEMIADAIPQDAIKVALSGSGESREILYGEKEN